MSVVLRGMASESAVCIFDSGPKPVGVARLVQIQQETCLMDVSVDNDIPVGQTNYVIALTESCSSLTTSACIRYNHTKFFPYDF